VVAPGAQCAAGGYDVRAGMDDNGDGILEVGEIDTTAYVCNGQAGTSAAVRQTTEPPGINCTTGGVRIDTGMDANGTHSLDAAEIQATRYVCNGIQGPAGPASLVAFTPEPSGPNCATGGQ